MKKARIGKIKAIGLLHVRFDQRPLLKQRIPRQRRPLRPLPLRCEPAFVPLVEPRDWVVFAAADPEEPGLACRRAARFGARREGSPPAAQ